MGPKFNDKHFSVWYPVSDELPLTKNLALDVHKEIGGELGGVLVTKIPAGKQVYPHVDRGWHAGYYEKFAVQIACAPGQRFCFADGALSPAEGELYQFDNSKVHWVLNPSAQDRITLITCIRRVH